MKPTRVSLQAAAAIGLAFAYLALPAEALSFWVGNTYHWPQAGELDAGEDVWINTETWPVGPGQSVTVHYRVNEGAWQSASAAWNFNSANTHWNLNLGSFDEGASIEYRIEASEYGTTLIDDNGGANYSMGVNSSAVELWVGNTWNAPADGEVNPGDEVWVETETWPIAPGQAVTVNYRVDGGPWTEVDAAWNYNDANNSHWRLNMGMFGGGSTLEYYVEAHTPGATEIDDGGGANYVVTVASPGIDFWVGNTSNWPVDGELDEGESLWIDTQTWPVAAGQAVTVHYRVDGAAFQTSPADWSYNSENSHWNLGLGTFGAGSTIEYFLSATQDGFEVLDTNAGANYSVTVNGSSGGGGGSPVAATLTWDPPTLNADGTELNDLAGYRLYWGSETGVYTEMRDVGSTTTEVVEGLTAGQAYYFAVTAYDTSGNESRFSAELAWSEAPYTHPHN